MEVGGIEGVRAIDGLGVTRRAGDVSPAFAVERAERMDEDSYGGNARRQDRGMEEDDAEEVTEDPQNDEETEMPHEVSNKQVNVVA